MAQSTSEEMHAAKKSAFLRLHEQCTPVDHDPCLGIWLSPFFQKRAPTACHTDEHPVAQHAPATPQKHRRRVLCLHHHPRWLLEAYHLVQEQEIHLQLDLPPWLQREIHRVEKEEKRQAKAAAPVELARRNVSRAAVDSLVGELRSYREACASLESGENKEVPEKGGVPHAPVSSQQKFRTPRKRKTRKQMSLTEQESRRQSLTEKFPFVGDQKSVMAGTSAFCSIHDLISRTPSRSASAPRRHPVSSDYDQVIAMVRHTVRQDLHSRASRSPSQRKPGNHPHRCP